MLQLQGQIHAWMTGLTSDFVTDMLRLPEVMSEFDVSEVMITPHASNDVLILGLMISCYRVRDDEYRER